MSGRQSSAPRDSLSRQGRGGRLVARRRRARRRVLGASIAVFFLLSAGIVYGLGRSAVRISHVRVFGAPAGEALADQSLADIATRAMQGNYFGIIPRDSAFFFPAERIRANIAAAHPGIAAVSIFRDGLTGLSIKANARVPVARWCGLAPTPHELNVPFDGEYCYLFDANGFIFAAAETTLMQTINSFVLYAPLEGGGLEPLRATLTHAEKLPSVFDFARQLATFGSPAFPIVFRADEVDMYLKSGTRVTYVLGDEQNAFTALVSSREHLNLADGSVEYVDLRFPGETYVKRKK